MRNDYNCSAIDYGIWWYSRKAQLCAWNRITDLFLVLFAIKKGSHLTSHIASISILLELKIKIRIESVYMICYYIEIVKIRQQNPLAYIIINYSDPDILYWDWLKAAITKDLLINIID